MFHEIYLQRADMLTSTNKKCAHNIMYHNIIPDNTFTLSKTWLSYTFIVLFSFYKFTYYEVHAYKLNNSMFSQSMGHKDTNTKQHVLKIREPKWIKMYKIVAFFTNVDLDIKDGLTIWWCLPLWADNNVKYMMSL